MSWFIVPRLFFCLLSRLSSLFFNNQAHKSSNFLGESLIYKAKKFKVLLLAVYVVVHDEGHLLHSRV